MEILGRHVWRMHSEAFAHRDLFARNVLVRVEEGDPAIALCDCRRGGPPSMRWKALDDLATLDSDLVGRVPDDDRATLIRAYAGANADVAEWLREIEKRSRKVARA